MKTTQVNVNKDIELGFKLNTMRQMFNNSSGRRITNASHCIGIKHVSAYYDIFVNNKVEEYLNSDDAFIQCDLADYFYLKHNEEKQIFHHDLAAKLGCLTSIQNIITFYERRKNYEKVNHYYKFLFEHSKMRREQAWAYYRYAKSLLNFNVGDSAKGFFIASAILGCRNAVIFLRKNYDKSGVNWKRIIIKLMSDYDESSDSNLLECIKIY
jgi:hypothetical protein